MPTGKNSRLVESGAQKGIKSGAGKTVGMCVRVKRGFYGLSGAVCVPSGVRHVFSFVGGFVRKRKENEKEVSCHAPGAGRMAGRFWRGTV